MIERKIAFFVASALILMLMFCLFCERAEAAPAWFPATRGQLNKEATKLAKIDSEIATTISRQHQIDIEFALALEKMDALTVKMEVLTQLSGHDIDELVSNTDARIDELKKQRDSMDEGSFMGGLKKLITGDYLGAILALLGLTGGTVYGVKQKKKSNHFLNTALLLKDNDKEKSREILENDPLFPMVKKT